MEHRSEIIKKWDRIDLFKADIYSLGLTFFKAVTGLNIVGINESKSKEQYCFQKIEVLDLPQAIK